MVFATYRASPLDLVAKEAVVVVGALRGHVVVDEVPRRGQHRHVSQGYASAHPAGLGHLPQVAEKAEAGHVGAGVDAHLRHDLGRRLVQGRHDRHRLRGGVAVYQALVDPCGDDPHAQRLGEQQPIPGPRSRLGHDAIGVHQADGAEAVLRLVVIDGVAAQDADPGLGRLVAAPAQDLSQQTKGEAPYGEADDVQSEQGASALGVDIAEGVGGGDGPEAIGVVDDRRDEVRGGDEGGAVGKPVGGGVLGALRGQKDVGVSYGRQEAQNLRKVLRTYFGGSAGTVGEGGQLELVVRR